MPLKSGFTMALRSVLALVLALAMVVLANLGGGGLADATGFPRAGEARLAWDLCWFFLAGLFAAWIVAKLAPRAPRSHAVVFFALMLVATVLAVIRLGDDWPRWFSGGLLLSLPLQVLLGTKWAMRGRKQP